MTAVPRPESIECYADPRVEIHAGSGALERLEDITAQLGASRVLVVTSQSFVHSDGVSRIRSVLDRRLAAVFAGCEPLVPDRVVDDAARLARDVDADLVVGLGGGSAVDTAKAVVVRLGESGSWEDLRVKVRTDRTLDVPELTGARLPLVAVPTTPTGAEGTPSVSVNVTVERRKVSVLDRACRPAYVLHDTDLVDRTPRPIAARAAMNGLANALESGYARPFSWFAAARPLVAAKLLGQGLDLLRTSSTGAGTRLLAGSYLAVVDFAESRSFEAPRSGLVHAVAHAISGRYDVAHGDCYSVLLPMGLRANAEPAAEVIAEFSDALVGQPSLELVLARLDEWRTEFGLPTSLRQLGLPRDALPGIAETALQHFALLGNPRPIRTASQIEHLLQGVW